MASRQWPRQPRKPPFPLGAHHHRAHSPLASRPVVVHQAGPRTGSAVAAYAWPFGPIGGFRLPLVRPAIEAAYSRRHRRRDDPKAKLQRSEARLKQGFCRSAFPASPLKDSSGSRNHRLAPRRGPCLWHPEIRSPGLPEPLRTQPARPTNMNRSGRKAAYLTLCNPHKFSFFASI